MFWGGDTFRRYKEFDVTKNYDLLIIGSSHAYNSYDTRILLNDSILCYNLGTSGQSLENTSIILKNYLHQGLTKNLILDVYPGSFRSSGLQSTCDLIINIPSNSTALDLAWSFPDIRAVNMLTLRTFYGLTNNQETVYKDTRFREGGFIAVRDSAIGLIDYDHFLNGYKASGEALKSLKDIISICSSTNTKLILVSHPAPQELNNESYLAFIKDARKISESHQIDFIDFSFDHPLDSKNHFYDVQHLNEAGARIFTKILKDELSKRYIFNSTQTNLKQQQIGE